MTTVWETDDQRLILEWDEYPVEPYDDGSWPILETRLGRHGGRVAEQLTSITSYRLPDDIIGAYNEYHSWHRDRDRADELFRRYLAIFHGDSTEPWVETRDHGHEYMAIAPKHWREAMGLTDEYLAAHRDVDVTPRMDGWLAYCNGETYVAVLQRRETWTNSRGETRDEWETVDAIGGLYGDWAESAALEHFPEPAEDEQVAS